MTNALSQESGARQFCFAPQPIVSLPIEGRSQRFPVGRVYCVGRNYAEHAREMGRDPEREPPFFFMKPASAVVPLEAGAGSIAMPTETANYQHEVELVIAIGSRADRVTPERALDHVLGYAVGLDMTRRDLQLQARESGRPWEFGKSFSPSAPIGPIAIAIAPDTSQPRGELVLHVNGQQRQRIDLALMIWDVAHCISYLSMYDVLLPGDLIMTGTPAGVAKVQPGDLMAAIAGGLPPITVKVEETA